MSNSRNQPPVPSSWSDTDDRLDSWKEIASYLQRTLATVRRWEKEEGLPVRRHVHQKKASVYAYRSEIDTWLANRGRVLGNDRPGWFRFFSENRKTLAGVVGGVTLLLLVGLVAWIYIGSSPNPEGLSFQERDWVLITDFENRTGEAIFDGVLEYALEREISNSTFVNVVPRERIEDTLRLMRKPLDTRIDRTLGREIGLRDGGIKALLTGRVEKLDSTYLLSVQVIDLGQGHGIAATSEEAAGQKQVLSALRSLSNWARETMGERLALIEESERKLEKVTTPSLQALQLFTKAEALISQGRSDLAEELLNQAIDVDSEFASAHIYLAHAIRNESKPPEKYLPHAERAFQLAETTGDRERYFIQGSYYSMKGEPESAIHAYETLLSLYPDHFWANNNLVNHYSRFGQEQRALNYASRLAKLRPTDVTSNGLAARALVLLDGDLIRARSYLNRALNLMTPEDIDGGGVVVDWLMFFPAFEALVQGDPQTALLEADRVSQTLKGLGLSAGWRARRLGILYLALGKLQAAQELFEGMNLFLSGTAYVKGDDGAMKKYLRQMVTEDDPIGMTARRGLGPLTPLLLVRAGLSSEAEKILHLYADRDSGNRAKEIDIARGALALSRGDITEGMAMIENTLPLVDRPGAAGTYFLGCGILAKAWRQQGDLGKAAQLLEEASEKKSFFFAQTLLNVPLWMELRLQLAQLYREMDRDADARKIEDELRTLLAYADRDHPILRQLDRTKELASLESGK